MATLRKRRDVHVSSVLGVSTGATNVFDGGNDRVSIYIDGYMLAGDHGIHPHLETCVDGTSDVVVEVVELAHLEDAELEQLVQVGFLSESPRHMSVRHTSEVRGAGQHTGHPRQLSHTQRTMWRSPHLRICSSRRSSRRPNLAGGGEQAELVLPRLRSRSLR